MKKDTVLVAVCNQKGGVGKSTMTIMLAGRLRLSAVQLGTHERKGYAYC